jgi:2,3,4,5-tetrahydropyridine-2,6-dicarboxylate N-succinyltransferase
MPAFVNIGARVGEGSMIDTWATVGSGAQIGGGVHISGGVGIGGVLEPPSARPVIIEDGAFIGSRCIIVEASSSNVKPYSVRASCLPHQRRSLTSRETSRIPFADESHGEPL